MKTALVLACDDNFVPYTSVVARRVAHLAAERFPIIVVSDGVSDENKRLAQKFCPQISFIEAASAFAGKSLPTTQQFSRAAYLRLFLDVILSDFGRAVYLDSDILPLTDITPLLNAVPKSAPLVATHDLHVLLRGEYLDRLGMTGAYFNSGVMVLDLAAIRIEETFKRALGYALEHPQRCVFVDQDALNAVLDGGWQVLDWRWNAMSYLSELMPKPPFIRHFSGYKPWAIEKRGIEGRFIREWRTALQDSPWPGRFHEEPLANRIRNIYSRVAASFSHSAKGLIHVRSRHRRGDRARLVRSLPKILSAIEDAASEGAVAAWPYLQDVK